MINLGDFPSDEEIVISLAKIFRRKKQKYFPVDCTYHKTVTNGNKVNTNNFELTTGETRADQQRHNADFLTCKGDNLPKLSVWFFSAFVFLSVRPRPNEKSPQLVR